MQVHCSVCVREMGALGWYFHICERNMMRHFPSSSVCCYYSIFPLVMIKVFDSDIGWHDTFLSIKHSTLWMSSVCMRAVRLVRTDLFIILSFIPRSFRSAVLPLTNMKDEMYFALKLLQHHQVLICWWIRAMEKLSSMEVLVPVMTRTSGTVRFAVYSNVLHAASSIEFSWLCFFSLFTGREVLRVPTSHKNKTCFPHEVQDLCRIGKNQERFQLNSMLTVWLKPSRSCVN